MGKGPRPDGPQGPWYPHPLGGSQALGFPTEWTCFFLEQAWATSWSVPPSQNHLITRPGALFLDLGRLMQQFIPSQSH